VAGGLANAAGLGNLAGLSRLRKTAPDFHNSFTPIIPDGVNRIPRKTIMNSIKFLAISLFAVLAAAAHADEADGSQYGIDFQAKRSRAEVQAEAARVSATRDHTPEAARPYGFVNSPKSRADVRTEAAEAVRLGRTSHGEIGG
jgi:hypothetical protein